MLGAFFGFLLKLAFAGICIAGIAVYSVYAYLEPRLPDVEVLRDMRYQIPMSVYSKDGKLIAQFGEKKRSPLSFDEVPRQVVNAFLAAEDDRFFDHPGVDYQGLLRAAVVYAATGEKRQGGSTITMQVARNFFLSTEKTFFRKINEILLAIKIESLLPKQQILELYLNKIYFGHHAYGVAAAAQVYYGKSVSELTLGELATIAGVPKAPSTYNPVTNPERAQIRRDYVLKRMLKLGMISDEQCEQALAEPMKAGLFTAQTELQAPYIAEMVRNEVYEQYGEDSYLNGYKVYTTVDSRLQQAAESALRQTLHEYDERHGFRGIKRHVELKKQSNEKVWQEALGDVIPMGDTVGALVLEAKDREADLYLADKSRVHLEWDAVRWATSKSIKALLRPGDVIRLRKNDQGRWTLAQVPEVEGALVSLDPVNGAIVSAVGGFDFQQSNFNRATQSQRQPGSGFKPILYSAALEAGYTPASVINDAPFVYYDPSIPGGVWRPQNYTGRFYGPTRLRMALAHSRNMVSIRLLREIGLPRALEMAKRFGFLESELPHSLTLALGSGTASPLRMAGAFAVFANGGSRVEPYLIDHILTQDGATLFRAAPLVACKDCDQLDAGENRVAPRVLTPQVHYMMNSMLQDVVRMGTATRALQLGRSDVAGKTGTTNEVRDAWFNGYAPALVAVTWMGFDSYKPLGDGETGGHAALPMWIAYMKEALKGVPEGSFSIPEGLTAGRIDEGTGAPVSPDTDEEGVFEIFPEGQTPGGASSLSADPSSSSDAPLDRGDDEAPALLPERPPQTKPAPKGSSTAIESLF